MLCRPQHNDTKGYLRQVISFGPKTVLFKDKGKEGAFATLPLGHGSIYIAGPLAMGFEAAGDMPRVLHSVGPPPDAPPAGSPFVRWGLSIMQDAKPPLDPGGCAAAVQAIMASAEERLSRARGLLAAADGDAALQRPEWCTDEWMATYVPKPSAQKGWTVRDAGGWWRGGGQGSAVGAPGSGLYQRRHFACTNAPTGSPCKCQ